jgi:hypothetical protein
MGRLAMDHVRIDLGKRESQSAILTEDGELITGAFGRAPSPGRDVRPSTKVQDFRGGVDGE